MQSARINLLHSLHPTVKVDFLGIWYVLHVAIHYTGIILNLEMEA